MRVYRNFELHIVELDRVGRRRASTASTRWLLFIANAEHWVEVPAGLSSPLLEKAMNLLDRINTHHRDVYEARLNEERRRIDQEAEMASVKAALAAEAEARAEAEAARVEAEAARAEAEARAARLAARLRALGLEED